MMVSPHRQHEVVNESLCFQSDLEQLFDHLYITLVMLGTVQTHRHQQILGGFSLLSTSQSIRQQEKTYVLVCKD